MFKNIGRTGTKILILMLIFIALLLTWLLVIMPVFLKEQFEKIVPYYAAIISALLGGGGVAFIINEIRKMSDKRSQEVTKIGEKFIRGTGTAAEKAGEKAGQTGTGSGVLPT